MKKTTTPTKTEITAASIARVSSKAGKFLGYLVKSDSSNEYYQVTWNEELHRWECPCKSARSIYPCKHCRAIIEVIGARKEQKPVEAKHSEQFTITEIAAEPVSAASILGNQRQDAFTTMKAQYDYRSAASLNNRNAGFQLLR